MEFRQHVPLAPFTTFEIGGPARWFAEATTESDIEAAVHFATERKLRLFVLGGGSNLLVSDAGFDGLVLHIGLRGVQVDGGSIVRRRRRRLGRARRSQRGCGTRRNRVSQRHPRHRRWNTGAERGRLRAGGLAHHTAACAPSTGRPALGRSSNAECGFAYRRSRFNQGPDRERFIVSRVIYALEENAPAAVTYADLKHYLRIEEWYASARSRCGPPCSASGWAKGWW